MGEQKISFSAFYLRAVRRLHMVPALALFAPLLCALMNYALEESGAAGEVSIFPLYLSSLFLVIPAALLHLAEHCSKKLILYVISGVVITALVMAGFVWAGSISGTAPGPAIAADLAAILLVFFDAMQIHNNDNRRRIARLEEDPSWSGDSYLLPQPSFPVLSWFVIVYVFSLFLHSTGLGTAALAGAILYFFLIFPYRVLRGRENYLENRKHVSSVPLAGISHLHNRTIPEVLIPCGLVAVVSLLTAGGRRFLDIPLFPAMEDLPFGNAPMMESWVRQQMEIMNLIEDGAPPPAWLLTALTWIENAITVLAVFLVLWALAAMLLTAARRFGMIVPEERRKKAQEDEDEHTSLKPASGRMSREAAGIRRRYRRTILRARGHAPGISETPDEMERLSDLRDTPEMKALHEEYERVRYGL